MNKFNKVATTINATRGLHEMEQQVSDVKNSSLTEEEKSKALKSHNKMVKTVVWFVIGLVVAMGIFMTIGFSISGEMGAIFGAISMVAMVMILIAFLIIIKKKKLFSDWQNAYEKVDNGFDGLSESEINQLKPQVNEEKLIKYYRKQSWKYGIIFLIAIAIEFTILLGIGVPIYSPITIIITIIITIVWYIKEDTCQVEIHRIKSGYYKKDFGFLCQNCKTEVKIKFEEIDKYNSLPRNESGIRVMNCPKCNNPVPFYNFDIKMQDYKNYLEKIK